MFGLVVYYLHLRFCPEPITYTKCTFEIYIDIVNGHRKQQLSYTENQQTLFFFPIFIDARLTYKSQNTGVLTGVPHTSEPQW